MKKSNFYYLITLITLVSLGSCKDKSDSQLEIDTKIIENYLEENNISAKRHSSGLYYNIIEQGNGNQPTVYSVVDVKYKGYLVDGTVFDDTGDESIEFPLYSAIEGWQIGIPLLREGGIAHYYIPSDLAYGDEEKEYDGGVIPANSVLIFEVELVDIVN